MATKYNSQNTKGRRQISRDVAAWFSALALLLGTQLAWSQSTSTDASKADTSDSKPKAASVYSLENFVRLLQQDNVKAQAAMSEREESYRDARDQSRKQLEKTQQRLLATEAKGRRLEQRFEDNRVALIDKADLLKNKIGALKELFGVFQQNASDLIGAFTSSPTSLQYPDRDIWLEGFANRMKNASEVTSADDIKTLWFELMREIAARGKIVSLRAPVLDAEGSSQERELVRVGGFDVISADAQPQYLQWRAGKQQVAEIPRQPAGPYAELIAGYAAGDKQLSALAVDPTGGILVSLLAEKPTTRERADQGGLVGYMIIGLGVLAFLLALAKLVDITVISLRVAAQRKRLDQADTGNSLGRLLLSYQKYQHADSEILEMRLHDRVAKESARIQRFAIFLAIIAAVAPLMGLLGTVVGMINTFQAITLYGTGDPQTMAGGISQALITTVLGLIVAVPAVLLNAMVSARAKTVINVLRQQMALLLGDRLQEEHDEDAQSLVVHAAPQPA